MPAGLVQLIDFLFPPRCAGCGSEVSAEPALCAPCWRDLRFISDPHCSCCGLPFETSEEAGLCVACAARLPRFQKARAALHYDDASRPLILALKHGDRADMAPLLARWMQSAAPDLIADAQLILPVPLHPWRLFRRRYNQAQLIARALGELTGITVDPHSLARRRRTLIQGGLGRRDRIRNVRGAFTANGTAVKGRHVLLIDDVVTTGATVEACASALTRAGAASVSVLAAARVVMPRHAD